MSNFTGKFKVGDRVRVISGFKYGSILTIYKVLDDERALRQVKEEIEKGTSVSFVEGILNQNRGYVMNHGVAHIFNEDDLELVSETPNIKSDIARELEKTVLDLLSEIDADIKKLYDKTENIRKLLPGKNYH